ncbi:MAG: hypothetical protein K0S62_3753, partial [Kosakonia cowanii]|nr:hypothetical protein [Kosakonia cowanii]
RSPPACLTAAGSTRHPVSVRLCPPSMASRPCHSRSGSPISAGVNTAAARPLVNAMKVSLWARFCRPDKAKPPSGNCAAAIMPDARNRLSSLGGSSGSIHVCRIRQSRHPAIVPGRECRMALALIRPTRFQQPCFSATRWMILMKPETSAFEVCRERRSPRRARC